MFLIENGVINYHNLLRPAALPFQFRLLLAICLLRKDPLCFLYYAAIIIALHFVRAENHQPMLIIAAVSIPSGKGIPIRPPKASLEVQSYSKHLPVPQSSIPTSWTRPRRWV